jgi:hypothetical protein
MDTIERGIEALRNLTSRDKPTLSKVNENTGGGRNPPLSSKSQQQPAATKPSSGQQQQQQSDQHHSPDGKHTAVMNDLREAMEELSCADDPKSSVALSSNAQLESRDLARCRLLEPPDSYWNQRRGSAPEYVGNRPAQETFRQQSLGEQGSASYTEGSPSNEGPYYGGARPRPIPVLQISQDEGDGLDLIMGKTSPDISPVLENRPRTQRSHSLPGRTIMGFGEAIGAIASNEQPKFSNTLSPRRTPGRRKSITVTEEGAQLDPIDEDGTLKQACSRRYSACTVSYSDRGRRE